MQGNEFWHTESTSKVLFDSYFLSPRLAPQSTPPICFLSDSDQKGGDLKFTQLCKCTADLLVQPICSFSLLFLMKQMQGIGFMQLNWRTRLGASFHFFKVYLMFSFYQFQNFSLLNQKNFILLPRSPPYKSILSRLLYHETIR